MNSLSWFLYATNVVENIGILLFLLLVFSGICFGILNIAVPASEGQVLEWKDYKLWWTRGLVTIITCGFILAFLPSKNTMYAIAASQIGEKVSESEMVQGVANDATKALQQWIKKQIEPEKKS